MAGQLTSFSFANLSCLVNDSQVTGFWEGDDVINIEQNKPDGNPVVGVDGCAVVSRPVDQSAKITIQCSPNGDAHKMFTNMKRSIDSNQRQNFAFAVTDTGNGEGGASTEATIIEAPNMQFGENAVARTWILFANNFRWNEVEYTV